MIWNRRKTLKEPLTGVAPERCNDLADQVIRPMPELRIIDMETWQAVQARLAAKAFAAGASRAQALQQVERQTASPVDAAVKASGHLEFRRSAMPSMRARRARGGAGANREGHRSSFEPGRNMATDAMKSRRGLRADVGNQSWSAARATGCDHAGFGCLIPGWRRLAPRENTA
jgi:hypothetical protein